MVGMTAMMASEAQKKANNLQRETQIADGIAKAQEMGLGVWAVIKAGRDFIKVEDEVNQPLTLPLFTNE